MHSSGVVRSNGDEGNGGQREGVGLGELTKMSDEKPSGLKDWGKSGRAHADGEGTVIACTAAEQAELVLWGGVLTGLVGG